MNERMRRLSLAVVSAGVSLTVVLAILRWFAPGLLGIAPDMQLVEVGREVPPFYENVFRLEDAPAGEFLLQDPVVIKRAVPLFPDRVGLGPHDVLGFRNRTVPAVADVVTIGDSQTYGNNAPLELNWPGRLAAALERKRAVVYNVSCGGWDGIQYLEILDQALRLSPRVVVVAFYTGNDPLGAFAAVYGSDRWADLRPDDSLGASDAPRVPWPPAPEDSWIARFPDGWSTGLTPKLRLVSNRVDHPAVQAGYDILIEVGRRIASKASKAGVAVVFTVIPTKELALWPRIENAELEAPDELRELVRGERHYIELLAGELGVIPGARFVDVVGPLQEAASTGTMYPPNANGHPLVAGYRVIAEALAPAVETLVPDPPSGLLFHRLGEEKIVAVYARDGNKWVFSSAELVGANGWEHTDARLVSPRDVANLVYRGEIQTVEPDTYGPGSWR